MPRLDSDGGQVVGAILKRVLSQNVFLLVCALILDFCHLIQLNNLTITTHSIYAFHKQWLASPLLLEHTYTSSKMPK